MLGACWTLTKFWEFLGDVDLFWDFEKLSKEERKMKRRSWDLGPLLGFLGICNGNGMSAHGFTHVYTYFVCINRRIGNVIREIIVNLCDVNVC
jgi:hypothetical protein